MSRLPNIVGHNLAMTGIELPISPLAMTVPMGMLYRASDLIGLVTVNDLCVITLTTHYDCCLLLVVNIASYFQTIANNG